MRVRKKKLYKSQLAVILTSVPGLCRAIFLSPSPVTKSSALLRDCSLILTRPTTDPRVIEVPTHIYTQIHIYIVTSAPLHPPLLAHTHPQTALPVDRPSITRPGQLHISSLVTNMSVKEHTELVVHCCSTCCKAADFGMQAGPPGHKHQNHCRLLTLRSGTHDYCSGSSYYCPRCPH